MSRLPNPTSRRPRDIVCALAAGLVLLAGCGEQPQGVTIDPEQVDATQAPLLGACRALDPKDLANAANASVVVACTEPHTAETYLVRHLPEEFMDAGYDDPRLVSFAGRACSTAFSEFLGTDESVSMRTLLNWVWFRPSENAWKEGARWFRCDAVGGAASSTRLTLLPETVSALLAQGPDDAWMACVDAPSVSDSPRIACDQPHLWRAVTTIKLGDAEATYPGDDVALRRTKDFCSRSVSAWLGYPPDFDFGYTWFGEAAWQSGNRRSVCWARTSK